MRVCCFFSGVLLSISYFFLYNKGKSIKNESKPGWADSKSKFLMQRWMLFGCLCNVSSVQIWFTIGKQMGEELTELHCSGALLDKLLITNHGFIDFFYFYFLKKKSSRSGKVEQELQIIFIGLIAFQEYWEEVEQRFVIQFFARCRRFNFYEGITWLSEICSFVPHNVPI